MSEKSGPRNRKPVSGSTVGNAEKARQGMLLLHAIRTNISLIQTYKIE
jgi:hypothetical protein